jgi:hypothetical protein
MSHTADSIFDLFDKPQKVNTVFAVFAYWWQIDDEEKPQPFYRVYGGPLSLSDVSADRLMQNGVHVPTTPSYSSWTEHRDRYDAINRYFEGVYSQGGQ